MPQSKAAELYQAGDLTQAVDSLSAEVKKHPTDQDRRGLLVEFLCIQGELTRADKQLDVLIDQAPAAAVGLALLRQLVRAELSRQEFYRDGRVPELLGEPNETMRRHLEASVLLRDGDTGASLEVLDAAQTQRAAIPGECDGARFDDIRDMDDLVGPMFEVLTPTGKFFWVPMMNVTSMEFYPPERPRDLLWRRAHMSVRGGPDGDVFLPAIYADPAEHTDDRLRLGRATEWVGGDGAPVRGVGQRTLLVGDSDLSIMQITTIEIDVTD